MNFEDAYQKLRAGTATDEEAAFVARELENVRKISAVLDDPGLSDPGITKAGEETVKKARKEFNKKTLVRTIVTVLCVLASIAAIVCAILFIPSNITAAGKQNITKQQAVDAAKEVMVNELGAEEAETFYVDYAIKHLRYERDIFHGVYVYKVEFQDAYGREYEIEVNTDSGYAVIRDIDY